jgi:hypothetical protein
LSADRGTYRLNLVDPFIQPTFDVQSGTLVFPGTPDLNPTLAITAIHTVRQPRQSANGRDVRVEVDITGTLAQPRLALRNPDNLPLSESDLLSYLVTGEPAIGLDNTTGQVAAGLEFAQSRIFSQMRYPRISSTSSSFKPRLRVLTPPPREPIRPITVFSTPARSLASN